MLHPEEAPGLILTLHVMIMLANMFATTTLEDDNTSGVVFSLVVPSSGQKDKQL